MSNLNELAFPLIEDYGDGPNINRGLTKHEYAAILIVPSLVSKLDGLPNTEERQRIAGAAYDLAAEVLNYFK